MRLLQLIGTTLFAVAIYSCGQGKSQSDERVPVNTDSTSCEKELYSYYIDDNIILQSKILPQSFNTDSVSNYQFIKDYEERIYQATLIDIRKPSIFQEGVYPDITNGKRKYFIYTNDEYNRNLIYIGTLLSFEQMIEAGFVPTQAYSDTVIPIRRINLDTPKQQEAYIEKENRKFYESLHKKEEIQFAPMK